MNAFNVNNLKYIPKLKNIETASYVSLAALLIGHVFFLEGLMSADNIMLIAVGIIFGAMASVSWTPVWNQINRPANINLAEVLSMKKADKSDMKNCANDQRAA